MEYAIGLFILVVRAICGRYLLPFVAVTVVLTLVVGGISHLSGGAFWLAAKYTLEGCVGLGVVATLITAFTAVSRGN